MNKLLSYYFGETREDKIGLTLSWLGAIIQAFIIYLKFYQT